MNPGFLAVVLVIVYGPAHPAQVFAQEGCPAPYAAMEDRIQYFLTEPRLSDLRSRYNIHPAAGAEVAALSSAKDRDACVQLWAALRARPGRRLAHTDRVAFYRADGFYFVSIHPPQPTDRIRIGETGGIEVYDSEFRFVLRLMA